MTVQDMLGLQGLEEGGGTINLPCNLHGELTVSGI